MTHPDMRAILDELTVMFAGSGGGGPGEDGTSWIGPEVRASRRGQAGAQVCAATEGEAGARAGTGKPGDTGARPITVSKAETLADDAAFNDLAMRIHAAQRATNPVLRRFWDAAPRGTPGAWHEIPPVPAAAFRDMAIVSGTPERVFRTSGTMGGGGRRGEHHVLSLGLYRAAARANYRRHLMQGAHSLRTLSLIPDPREVPDSSLSAMAGFIAGEPGITDVTWAFHPRDGVNVPAVRDFAAVSGEPVLVLTTAFALVHLLDALGGRRIPLPPGSRMMETGGFKGRAEEVERATLYRRVEHTLDVPAARIVNEYGMTELLSQAYDGVAGTAPPPADRLHRFPAWVRTRALDPATLAPLPPERPGLLAHFDLANAGSVCRILTEDFGHTTADGGLRLMGRAPGAVARGCSLAAESFLRNSRPAP